MKYFENRCLYCWEYFFYVVYVNLKLYIVVFIWYFSELYRQENQKVIVNVVYFGIVNIDFYKYVYFFIKWFLNLLVYFIYLVS